MQRRSNHLPFIRISDLNRESDPTPDQKCVDCAGEGVITIFSVTTGLPLHAAICPTCGGTRYAP